MLYLRDAHPADMIIRLIVVVHLMRSTSRVLRMLRAYATSAVKSADLANVPAIKLSVMAQVVLIRRLAACAKLVAAASLALMLVTCCMGLRIAYYQPNPVPTLALDSLFLTARLVASLAAVLFCQPPPDRRMLEKRAAHTSLWGDSMHTTASMKSSRRAVAPTPTSRNETPATAAQPSALVLTSGSSVNHDHDDK